MDIHFIQEKVQRGKFRVLHIPSRYQIADIFTKGLPKILFDDFRSSLSVRQPPDSTAGCIRSNILCILYILHILHNLFIISKYCIDYLVSKT